MRQINFCNISAHLAANFVIRECPFPAILPRLSLCLFALVFLLWQSCDTSLAEVRNVGFYNMGISLPERELNLDINVWYPTDSRRRRPYKLQSWSFRAAGKTAVSPGSWPLILLSHPSSGNRLTHHNTASDLAARGFIVAVMTHPFDNLDSMPDLYSWDLFVHRARDLRLLLDIILNHEHFAQSIDRERIGVLGFGAGGAAALLVGGALPDCTLWDTFCTGSDLRNPYCNSWAKNRIDKNICPALPLKHSLADVRVKACALVEPGFSMLFSHDALAWFYPPVLLVRGGVQRDQALMRESELFTTRFGRRIEKVTLPRADEESFMAPCPERLLQELPELCYSVDDKLREEIHERLVSTLADFFTRTLATGSPRAIPAPPVFEPVGPMLPERKGLAK